MAYKCSLLVELESLLMPFVPETTDVAIHKRCAAKVIRLRDRKWAPGSVYTVCHGFRPRCGTIATRSIAVPGSRGRSVARETSFRKWWISGGRGTMIGNVLCKSRGLFLPVSKM